MMILAILIPLILFGTMGGVAYHFIKKTDPKKNSKEEKGKVNSAQEFIPIEDIEDGFLILKGGKHRRIIECSSTNYDLKTEDEQIGIEMIFQRFLNSLTFPISFFLQTRIIDNSKMLSVLREDIAVTKRTFPNLVDHAEKYLLEMQHINETIGNSKQKKRYIIIPYDEDLNIDSLTDEERIEYTKKELDNRCSVVINGLSALGVKTNILDNKELVELVYSTFYRDDYSFSEFVDKDEAMSLFVESDEDLFKGISPETKLTTVIEEAINIMAVNDDRFGEEDKEFLKNLRKAYDKYFHLGLEKKEEK